MATESTAVHTATANGIAKAASTATPDSSQAAVQLLREFLQVQSLRAEVYSRFNQGFRELLDHGQEAVFARLMQEVTPAFNAASQQVIHIESCLNAPAVNRPDLAALLRGVQEQERLKLQLTLSWQALRAAHASGHFSWQDAADRPRTQAAAAAARHTQQAQQQQQHLLSLLGQMQVQPASMGGRADDVAVAGSDQDCPSAAVKPGFYEQQMQRAMADAAAASQQDHVVEGSAACAQHSHAACGAAGHGCQHGHSEPADPLEPNAQEPTEAEYNAAVREALQELDACVVSINALLEEVKEVVQDFEDDDVSV